MYFSLRFYHSILDDIDNIKYDEIAQTIASISTTLSYSLYTFLTNSSYSGLKKANNTYVSKNRMCILICNAIKL